MLRPPQYLLIFKVPVVVNVPETVFINISVCKESSNMSFFLIYNIPVS